MRYGAAHCGACYTQAPAYNRYGLAVMALFIVAAALVAGLA